MAQEVGRSVREDAAAFPSFETASLWHSIAAAWAPWKKRPLGVIGAVIVIFSLTLAITAPLTAPYDPNQFAGGRLDSPNGTFLLGTNTLGQDVLSRTIY